MRRDAFPVLETSCSPSSDLYQLAYQPSAEKTKRYREKREIKTLCMKKKKEALDLYLTIKTTRITCVCTITTCGIRYSN